MKENVVLVVTPCAEELSFGDPLSSPGHSKKHIARGEKREDFARGWA